MSTSAVSNVSLSTLNWAMGHRLSLTSATPVTTSNVTGATTIYLTPFMSGAITLFYAGVWNSYTTAEINIALGTLSNASNYDVFAYYTGTAVALEFSAVWTNSTTRADAITRLNGIYVKSSDHTRLYVGTFHTTATTTTEDSFTNRYLWNMYNRVPKIMRVTESTATWTYAIATWRNANGNTANSFNYVAGDVTRLKAQTSVGALQSSFNVGATGIGIDTATTNSANIFAGLGIASGIVQNASAYDDYPAIGSHTINWIELAASGVTVTFYGNEVYVQSGMIGEILG